MIHKARSFALAVCVLLASPAYSLEIILNDTTGSSAEVLAGFEAAADIWESIFTDDVTVRIDVGYTSLDPGVLGQASSNQVAIDYATVRGAMVGDATSAFDATAVGSLTDSADFQFIFRDPLDPAAAYAVAEPFGLDAWNTFLAVNTANAKSLGLLGDVVAADASITFSSDFNFDFDPSDGIAADAFDFIGVAAHEIGHALGFVSGVDIMDLISAPGGPLAGCCTAFGDFFPDLLDISDFAVFSTLDLFRYSEFSASVVPGLFGLSDPFRDFTFGDFGDIYLSLDGGLTALGTMSTGAFNGLGSGGGRQASHWEDLLGLGLMDPTAGFGELLGISDLDRIAFDAIGWDLVGATRVPEPGTLSLLLLGLGGLLARRRVRTT